jgi:hypothetical protein
MAEHAIRDLDQAKRYLDDPTLGERLRTMSFDVTPRRQIRPANSWRSNFALA